MNYQLFNGDCFDFKGDMKNLTKPNTPICVITDPPYSGYSGAELLSLFKLLAWGGNILAFCSPENQYYKADEYAFWYKTPSTKNYSKHIGRFIEIILIKRQGTVFNQLHWSQMTGVYDDRLIVKPRHPFEKPLSLMERLIRIYSNPGDTIIDPFCGSATTGMAALMNNRKFIGIEKDSKHFELAQNNMAYIQDYLGNL